MFEVMHKKDSAIRRMVYAVRTNNFNEIEFLTYYTKAWIWEAAKDFEPSAQHDW